MCTQQVSVHQTYTLTAFALQSTTPIPSVGQVPLSRHQPHTLEIQGLKAPQPHPSLLSSQFYFRSPVFC